VLLDQLLLVDDVGRQVGEAIELGETHLIVSALAGRGTPDCSKKPSAVAIINVRSLLIPIPCAP
jgi:hypothetical protein